MAMRTLQAKRTSAKGQLTQFVTFIETCTQDQLDQIPDRLLKLEDLYTKYDEAQTKIEEIKLEEMDSRDPPTTQEERERLLRELEFERSTFENRYYKSKAKARSLIQHFAEENNREHTTDNSQYSTVKLPTLQLPRFNGNYNQWLPFKDTFTSVIDLNNKITGIQKFQYLKSALTGEALQVINMLETTETNYAIAWELIKKRYENKKLIINTHLKELFELTPVNKGNHTSLRALVDAVRTHLRALEALGQEVEKWDTILIYLVSGKLDYTTRKDWELHVGKDDPNELPSMDGLIEFITNRAHTLELVEGSKGKQDADRQNNARRSEKRVTLAATSANILCNYCKGEHMLYHCQEFAKLAVNERRREARQRQLCLNCLRKGHYAKECRASNCRRCSEKHNTLLHMDKEAEEHKTTIGKNVKRNYNQAAEVNNNQEATSRQTDESKEEISQQVITTAVIQHVAHQSPSMVLLATARVYIEDNYGRLIQARAMLDPGSQFNIITADLTRKLSIPMRNESIPLSGIGRARTSTKATVHVQIKSTCTNYSTKLECQVMSVITERLPQVKINKTGWNIPADIVLADPEFNVPGNIDLLIGSAAFWPLLCMEQMYLCQGLPVLQRTELGWIVGGEVIKYDVKKKPQTCHLLTYLDKQLEKFWSIEELPEKEHLSIEDQYCEDYFQETVKRNLDGRYIVRLPVNQKVVGNTTDVALRRLNSMENKFKKQVQLHKSYVAFMQDYESLGHMSNITRRIQQEEIEEVFYLPHQAVIRDTNVTTKLRVVFDASAKASNGIALNDKLLRGPNIQSEIWNIILRFRCHQYVVTADIAMMYRQILVDERDRNLQRIYWRYETSEPIQVYALNTVTYGTSCAPFLANRCLRHLAYEEEAKQFPLAAEALKRDFYMDDVITGCDTIEQTKKLQQQLSALLAKAQFPLRKWRSNEATILQELAEESRTDELLILDKDEPMRTLGILWNSKEDILQYEVHEDKTANVTKRSILSQIARIYDPLGLIGPVLIRAKLTMQELWKLKLNWEDNVPDEMRIAWANYYESLPQLNELRVHRNINPQTADGRIDIHGFGDASEKAYGASVYCTYKTQERESKSSLICSKSRVAPLKTVTLPKLELCAALLLSQTVHKVQKALQGKINNIYLWSDSTIVLCWIKRQPSELKTFYANRVAEIQRLMPHANWNHVCSEQNPADVLSRGTSVEELKNNNLWWQGPRWLMTKEKWPQKETLESEEDRDKEIEAVSCIAQDQCSVLYRYSTFIKLQRIIAYCLRFTNKKQDNQRSRLLNVAELTRARNVIMQMLHKEKFSQELKDLRTKGVVDAKSPLRQLNPYIDNNGLIRVGGRLKNANISQSQKHPIVLPSRHHVTTIIMRDDHIKLKHCGPQQLLCSIRSEYWPLSGRREARKITRRCVQCFRIKPEVPKAIMADLPKSRVTVTSRPFNISGLDYAGPLMVRESRRRGNIPISKAYIAVFICFNTKAMHLELISSLDTDSFMAALKRFFARRGTSAHIYSDNGSNFVGAANELKAIYNFVQKESNHIAASMANQQVTWHFIPPRSPNFGGLWESAVKSVKRHLKTITQGLKYTFEEYYTMLVEIEGILNSRPLLPLSSDPNDFSALTPSHFLTGDSLTRPAEISYIDTPDNRLSRWQHLQKLRQHFWKRWTSEYLQQLQTRTRWQSGKPEVSIGSMVLVIEDNLPPLQWNLGRIEQLHPGEDGVIRVVTVRTPTGVYKRSVRKVCALPIEEVTSEIKRDQ